MWHTPYITKYDNNCVGVEQINSITLNYSHSQLLGWIIKRKTTRTNKCEWFSKNIKRIFFVSKNGLLIFFSFSIMVFIQIWLLKWAKIFWALCSKSEFGDIHVPCIVGLQTTIRLDLILGLVITKVFFQTHFSFVIGEMNFTIEKMNLVNAHLFGLRVVQTSNSNQLKHQIFYF